MSQISTKRSDHIRTKRTDQIRKTKASGGRRKAKLATPAVPPVMARNASPVQSFPAVRSVKKTRRRFDLPLGTPGVEMSLPAIPRLQFGWRILSLTLLAAFAYGLFFLWDSPEFKVEAAQINGLKRVSDSAVDAVLGISGQSIFAMDASHMEQLLQDEFHEFSSTEVSVMLPDTVLITVTERTPVLIWSQEGRTYMVDEKGVTFPLREGSEDLSLPRVEANANPPAPLSMEESSEGQISEEQVTINAITGIVETDAMKAHALMTPDMVKAVLLLAENAPQDAVLSFTAENGLSWQDKRGWSVFFGSPDDMEMKLRVYHSIIDHLKSQNTRPEMISVEFVMAPYFRLADEQG